MKTYTVNQLAQLSGVSVRTLHHYDAIGLLTPAFIGDNRYRYYGREELLRLQQILIHRELDISLQDIGTLLNRPGFDRLAALTAQRERLVEKTEHYRQLVRTIDRTIADLKGDRAMKDADLYEGIVAPEKQAEYEQWLLDRFGEGTQEAIAHGRQVVERMTDDQRRHWMVRLAEVEEGLAEGLRRGVAPESAALDPLLRRHFDWVASSQRERPGTQWYANLADLYEHPGFVSRYEQIEPGFAAYLVAAMKAWAARQPV